MLFDGDESRQIKCLIAGCEPALINKTGRLVVISGPSGVGKSTIAKEVLNRTGAAFSVSATTRRPREGERDGREYRFVDRQTFQQMIADSELLEWAEVFGEYYGTPAAPVRQAVRAGETILLDIDVQGGRQVHEKMPEATFVLIVPPGGRELADRLAGRDSESQAQRVRRLAKAEKEIETAKQSGVYNRIVVNDNLETAIGEVVKIVNEE